MNAQHNTQQNTITIQASAPVDARTFSSLRAAGFAWDMPRGAFIATATPEALQLARDLAPIEQSKTEQATPACEAVQASGEAETVQASGEENDDGETVQASGEDAREIVNDYEARQAARRERYASLADKMQTASAMHYSASRRAVEHIPLGQPILVGHHSERGHRATLARAHRAMDRSCEAASKAEHYAQRAASVGSGGISSDDPAALVKLRAEHAQAERLQQTMKDTNKVIRAHKTHEARAAALVALGMSESQAAALLKPDFMGRIGFPDYRLKNNGANVRRIAGRIAEIEARRQADDVERAGNGYTYREDVDENRVMFEFPSKPADEVRDILKKAGFRWSPSRAAWVRQLNNAGRWHGQDAARQIDALSTPEDAAPGLQASGEEKTAQASGEEETAPQNIAAIAEPTPEPTPAPAADPGADFAAMRASLRAGVQAVSAPQLFPTPATLAARMVELADIQPGARVLEPSAGTGRILDAIGARQLLALVAVECNHQLAARLATGYQAADVLTMDFLEYDPGENFDRVLMNPPFINGADIKHIQHAASLLKPGGRLVALCANGPRQRAQLMPLAEYWEDLPAGTFKESGTDVRAALLVIEAPDATGTDDDAGEADQVQASGEQLSAPAASEPTPSGEAWRAQGFDPTEAADYAQIAGNTAALEWWQDVLDSFFGSRLVEIRNALRALGWEGGIYPAPAWPLTKGEGGDPMNACPGCRLVVDIKHVGAGRNMAGVTWRTLDADGTELERRRDDLNSSAQNFAYLLDITAHRGQKTRARIDAEAKSIQASGEAVDFPQPGWARRFAESESIQASGEEKTGTPSGEQPAAAEYKAPAYPADRNARELVQAVEKVDLLKRFDYLKPATDNPLVTAAKNIRTELKRAWPGLKFSVTSERFSMGDAIRINWTDGPTSKQVDAIANKYKAGSFDGMEDIYNYDTTGFNALFGDAKYITTSRDNSDAAIAAALAAVARKFGAPPFSLEDYKTRGAWQWQTHDGHRLDSEVHQALSAADHSLAPLAQAI